MSDTVFKLQGQVFRLEKKIHEMLHEIVQLEQKCYKRVHDAKTKVAVLNSPNDVPTLPVLLDRASSSYTRSWSQMDVTDQLLQQQRFSFKENPDHKEEVH